MSVPLRIVLLSPVTKRSSAGTPWKKQAVRSDLNSGHRQKETLLSKERKPAGEERGIQSIQIGNTMTMRVLAVRPAGGGGAGGSCWGSGKNNESRNYRLVLPICGVMVVRGREGRHVETMVAPRVSGIIQITAG